MGGAAVFRFKVVEQVAILSTKRGGAAAVKTYCLYFQERPQRIERRLLCDGCPDYQSCAENPPPAMKALWLYVK